MTNDVEELIEVVEADDGHEGARQLRVIRRGQVAWRLVQVEVEREQRRQQVVAKALGPLPNLSRHDRGIEKLEVGLMGVQRRCDQLARPYQLAVARLDAERAPVLHDDARRFGHQADVAAGGANGSDQGTGERRAAAAGHLRLRRARNQRGDVVAEAALTQVDLPQPVEEQQAGLHGRVLELPLHELERRKGAHVEQPAARAVRSSSARRSAGGSGGERCSGPRMPWTIGTNSSCQRRSVSASRLLNCATDPIVFSMSVHHLRARPSRVISATLSSGSM